ncbi:MAG: DUF2341 domain-containing protein [Planctomycetaceae bacterium]|nr:DUF2341 domain-containing protein [Planctomycetaceae bacterium]
MTNHRWCSTVVLALLCVAPQTGLAQYDEWPHHGTLVLLTTPDGADLPDSSLVEGFPVLVRLGRETFDFRQSQPDGSDIRFSENGQPLACQIEEWNADEQTASIWVRVPVIRGNSRQELQIHWGKMDAARESDGAAVFGESNGYAVVMHLAESGETLCDEIGRLTPTNRGTTVGRGAIGFGRQFDRGQGINCGEELSTLPAGRGSFTTSAWVKADVVNTTALGWGNEQAQGKVVMQVRSPPHLRIDGYFSSGTVTGEHRLPLADWVHIVQVCTEGESRLYLNGEVDGVTINHGSPLDIRNPARMWLGGWYNNYNFVGAMDEVRISAMERSADWVKLCYENQKPNQTLVGTLQQPGNALEVSPQNVVLSEASRVTVTAEAGGAEKVYWILTRDGDTPVVTSDQFSFEIDAGRVAAETNWKLTFRAVYPEGVKTKEVPVTIRNTIPEPVVSLDAPASWNGRDSIEIVPHIANHEAMRSAGAGRLQTHWTVENGATIHEVAEDRLILKRSQYSGKIRVTAAISNGGTPTKAAVEIQVTEPSSDLWIERVPEMDEKPEEGQFYARNDRNEGTLFYNGRLEDPADTVFLRTYADDELYHADSQPLAADGRYAFSVKLKPGLVQYRVEFGHQTGEQEEIVHRVSNLVCGDAFLIDGQSNALATDTREDASRETSQWIRSYGGPTGRVDGNAWLRDRTREAELAGLQRPNLWCRPVWKRNTPDQQAEIGWWAMELAKQIVRKQKMPVCIIQAAIGGSRIDEHQPTPEDHRDLNTMYGRMLWRVQQARLTHGIRAVLWHQGENDQGADGPDGGYGWEKYQQYFVTMSAAWKEDMPNIRHYYVYQIWPNACAMGGRDGSGDRLREQQRTLPRLYSNMSIMSTLGISPPGGCHFPLEGWTRFAQLAHPLIERDLYGIIPQQSITPPNLLQAGFTTAARDEITLRFDQPVIWRDKLCREFYLDGQSGEVASGAASGNVVTLRLKAPTSATRITYLKERDWNQDRLLLGTNGLAALTFCDVPVE